MSERPEYKRRWDRKMLRSTRPSGYRGWLSPPEVDWLRRLRAEGLTCREISDLTGVNYCTVSKRTKDVKR